MSRGFYTDTYQSDPLRRLQLAGGADRITLLRKFGRIQGVTTTRAFVTDVMAAPRPFINIAGGSTVRIKASGNAADTAAGAGAREVTVAGLDGTGLEVSEAIATNGATVSAATTALFTRVNRAWVSSAGTFYQIPSAVGSNAGDIIIESVTATFDRCAIEAEEGQSQNGVWTVPLGKSCYIDSVWIQVSGVQAANVFLYQRRDGLTIAAPVSGRRIIQAWTGIATGLEVMWGGHGGVFPALTDLWFEAESVAATSNVSVEMRLVVR